MMTRFLGVNYYQPGGVLQAAARDSRHPVGQLLSVPQAGDRDSNQPTPSPTDPLSAVSPDNQPVPSTVALTSSSPNDPIPVVPLEAQPASSSLAAPTALGRRQRHRTPNVWLADYQTYTVKHDVVSTCKYPLTHYIGYARFSPYHRDFLSAVDSGYEPQLYKDAVRFPHWRQAMSDELSAPIGVYHKSNPTATIQQTRRRKRNP
ncbi:unnamed protein product [Cuscuta campestris]|uniref:Uncharacterized protein n=1 Tax=Cuscuta campestris TaxID=132261 RepID=A0A484KGB0_9ASTE|nr:unnamed protein product [Cuscuta campestris]